MTIESFDQLEFVVGETYSNRNWQYTVLAVHGSELRVRFDDGTVGTLNADIQRRIITNMAQELRTLTQAVGVETSEAPRKFMFSLGFLAARADLQAEIPLKSQANFEEKYRLITGEQLRQSTPGYYLLEDPNVDKWGPELRTYFQADPNELDRLYFGEHVEIRQGTSAGLYRINNNAFFYKLLELGFRIGPGQSRDLIRGRLPSTLRDEFDQGLAFSKGT